MNRGGESDLSWRALGQLLSYPPELLISAIGEDCYRGGVVTLFECLQCHTLNKQVSTPPILSSPSSSSSPSLSLTVVLYSTGHCAVWTIPRTQPDLTLSSWKLINHHGNWSTGINHPLSQPTKPKHKMFCCDCVFCLRIIENALYILYFTEYQN